ncbi:hypothetical protein [Actinomyces qiguomingii]|uniref:hypothetical protein n=1 Tax=Actinomyces qiguomingii TaxID=2057800 RepID=UPI000CA05A89|nr:hypothetical protein [Actinomyces qiguomingii]
MSRRPVGILFMGIVGAIYGIALIALILYCGYELLQRGHHMFAVCSSLVYLIISLAMGHELVKTNIHGREFYQRSLDRYRPRLSDNLAPHPTKVCARIAKYLIFPRPHDFAKVVFCIIGATVAAAPVGAEGTPTSQFLLAAVVCSVWEFVVSQTRFILNDLLGLTEDAAAPAAAVRRRIDTHMATRVGVINAGLLCRTLLTGVIVAVAAIRLPHARVCLLALIAAFVALTLVYESLRNIEHRPEPARWVQPGIRLTVALGYPLRVGAGVMSVVAVTGHDLPSTLFAPIVLVAGWAFFGADFLIRITWLQEGVGYLHRRESTLFKYNAIHYKPHIDVVLENFLKANKQKTISSEDAPQ